MSLTSSLLQRRFGSWLRRRRELLDLTQADLARLVDCSAITIRKIEANERAPSRQLAELLANALEIPAGERAAFVAFARGRLGALPAPPAPPPAPPPALPPTDLPVALTDLIGREGELAQLTRRLADPQTRLLTLVGPPGIGKTRLALAAAALLRAASESPFPDGAFSVGLAELPDPALLADLLTQRLGLPEAPRQTPFERLCLALRERRALLLLDNLEHLTAAGPLLARLLAACPRLTILATSRTALRISGERLFVVAPLGLPDPYDPQQPEILARAPAIQLFVERAQAIQPDFALDGANAAAVAAICARLDGLPLAIELAAARSRLLTPQALLDRLGGHLLQLSAGQSDLPTRQQTLRAAVEWSYQLLSPSEQRLFRRLGVFVGSVSLEAIEAVCGDGADAAPLLDTLDRLVGHSLVVRRLDAAGQPQFRLLELIRAYAHALLLASAEAEAIQSAHAGHYAGLAAATMAGAGDDSDRLRAGMAPIHDNLRAALGWLGAHDLPAGLRLAIALKGFWLRGDHFEEGRHWLKLLLARADDHTALAPIELADGWGALGEITLNSNDFIHSLPYLEQAARRYEQLGMRYQLALSLRQQGLALSYYGDYTEASQLITRAAAIFRDLGEERELARSLNNLGIIAKDSGDYPRAAALISEALALLRRVGPVHSVAMTLNNLASVAYWQGDYHQTLALARQAHMLAENLGEPGIAGYMLDNIGMALFRLGRTDEALPPLRQALATFQDIRHMIGEALVYSELGWVLLAQGDHAAAAAAQIDGLRIALHIGERRRAALCIEGLAAALELRRPAVALRLLAAAAATRAAIGAPLPPAEAPAQAALIERLAAAIPPDRRQALWEAGERLGEAGALAQLLADPELESDR